MDEEFYTIPPTSLPHGNQPNSTEFLHTNTVSIFVDSEWNGGNGNTSLEGVIQHCPAIYIPTPLQIPQAVKHIYSRLAASADSLDHGVPELILSLVGTGNSFSFENSERLINGLGKLFGRCSLWVITCGEHSDPLAYAASKALRSALLHRDNPEETLIIGINSADIHNISTKDPNFPLITRKEPPHMVDARLNTLYLVWGKNNPTERTLLIGVPEERTSISGSFSHSQTPISTQNSPATILLSSSLSNEKKPLNLVVFCGVTLSSLLELVIYAQCGVPSLVVQDISELCVVLKSAFSLFQSAVFEHNAFEFWLERELRMVALATAGRYLESEIIDLLIRSAPDVNEWASPLELSCKLGVSRPLNFICLEGHFTEKQFSSFLFVVLNLPEKERVNGLSSLLKQNIPLPVNSEFLIKWAGEAEEKHFFNTIVLGQLLGLQNSEQLTHIDENIATKFDNLLVTF
uniref:TRPM SLOG domain-containing protein n=1 Tax=Meloidogyne javanica TaxID=6303 RepID=A0A915MGI7_MELJA